MPIETEYFDLSAIRHRHRQLILIGVAMLLAAPLVAEVTGRVIVEGTGVPGQPIVGARVHVQADPTSPVVLTDNAGLFILPVEPDAPVTISAAVTYDPEASVHYNTGGVGASNGDDVVIRLAEIPVLDNLEYSPIKAAVPAGCGDCHGEQLAAWSTGVHSISATDEWVRDLYSGDGTPNGSAGYVFRDEHPGETGFCATCHAPAAEAGAPGSVFLDEVTGTAALEGVTCSACHQLDRFSTNVEALHLVADPRIGDGSPGAAFRFPLDGVGGNATHEFVWGPLDDVDYPFMRAAHAPVFSESTLCASCHEYVNPETGAPGQTTYSEWAASSYAVPGEDFRSCQNCHMKSASEPGPIADPVIGSAPSRPAEQRHDHGFQTADQPNLAASLHMLTGAEGSGGGLSVAVTVTNTGAGHSFPTGVSIRNAILLITASYEGAPLAQVSGPTVPWWANDNEPGIQEGDWAGFPGTGYAKVLSGIIDETRVEPVIFFDADSVASNTNLMAGESRSTVVEFALPSGVSPDDHIDLDVKLLYRRAWRALAVTKGWITTPQGGPIEIEVFHEQSEIQLDANDFPLFADGFEAGNAGAWTASQP